MPEAVSEVASSVLVPNTANGEALCNSCAVAPEVSVTVTCKCETVNFCHRASWNCG